MYPGETSRVLCLGEGLVVLSPDRPGGPWDRLRCSVGGAEANVAGGLSALGVPTTWVSRLGSDPFGDLVERDLVDRGITAGILAEDSDLLSTLVTARETYGFRLSVDLNWRPALWQDREVRPLLGLLQVADVLLLGADEAEAVLGTSDPGRLRERVGERPRLVIKSDVHAALEVEPDGTAVEVPALRVEVVEPVGAGDGFAAGYLAGLVEGLDAVGRLRLGHLVAASVLAVPGDHAHPPSPAVCRALAAADPQDWRATRVGPSGVSSPALARVEEAR